MGNLKWRILPIDSNVCLTPCKPRKAVYRYGWMSLQGSLLLLLTPSLPSTHRTANVSGLSVSLSNLSRRLSRGHQFAHTIAIQAYVHYLTSCRTGMRADLASPKAYATSECWKSHLSWQHHCSILPFRVLCPDKQGRHMGFGSTCAESFKAKDTTILSALLTK